MTAYYPSQDTDDSWEIATTGQNLPTTDPINVRANATDYRIGALRVQLTGVNQGDTVYTGTLYAYFSASSRDDIHCDVVGELVAAPGTFTTSTNHISGRLSANPTTATVEWQETGTGAGWYSIDVSSIIQELVNQGSWSDGGYIVLFLDPTAYTSAEFAWIQSFSGTNPWYVDVTSGPANSSPTIALNTADASTLDTTPTVEFTGSDADDDDLRYQVQVTDNPDGFTGGDVVVDSLESGTGTIIHPQPTGGTTWNGDNQIDDRVAFTFKARGGFIKSVQFYFGAQDPDPADCDGAYVAYLYEVGGGTAVGATPDTWATLTSYSVNDTVRPTSTANADVHLMYRCKTAGISGATEPSWPGSGVLWTAVTEGTEVNDGTVVWEVVYPQYPDNVASPANTPTPNWIAETDEYSYSPGVADIGWKTLTFTGGNVIRLTKDAWYMISLDWKPNDTVTTNYIAVFTADYAAATADGTLYLDASSTNNNGPRIIGDAYFRVTETFVLLDKVSGTDTGFLNTVTGGDTDPFNAGEKISFTVQAADELDSGITYYWHARVIDPGGANLWSSYATARSFSTSTTYSMVAAILAASSVTAPSLAVARAMTAVSLADDTTTAPSLAVVRALVSNALSASATSTPTLSLSSLLQLTAVLLAASASSDSSLAVTRPFTSQSLGASGTAVPSMAVLRAVAAQVLADDTTSIPSLSVARAFTAQSLAASLTTSPSLAVLRAMTAVALASSTGTAPSLALLFELVSAALASSSSVSPSLAVTKGMSAQTLAASTTAAPSLAVLRGMVSAALASSSTSAPVLNLTAVLQLVAAILSASNAAVPSLGINRIMMAQSLAASTTPSPSLAVIRGMVGQALGDSATAVPSLAVLREMVTAALADSVTSSPVLTLTAVLQLMAAALASSSTPPPSLAVTRGTSAQVLVASATATPSLAVQRALTAAVLAASGSSAPSMSIVALLTAVMLAQSQTSTPILDLADIAGLISVTFSASAPGAAFTGSRPGATFTGRRE